MTESVRIFIFWQMVTIFDIYVAKVITVAVEKFKRLKKTADQTNFGSKNEILFFVSYLILYYGCLI